MAITFKAKIKVQNRQELIHEVDHILTLLQQNFPSGSGWEIIGEEELPIIQIEDDEDMNEGEELINEQD